MKITEKLYVTRLEKMMKMHRSDPCPYCPMMKYYIPVLIGDSAFLGDDVAKKGFKNESCQICMNLTAKYASVACHESITDGHCPCMYFGRYFFGSGTKKCYMPKDYMVKVAWKVIRGWKKDNKQEVADG